MKISIRILVVCSMAFCYVACKESRNIDTNTESQILTSSQGIPNYTPKNQAFYDTILAMDKKYFDAYNTCDLETQADIYADDMEFYHDLGGLETNKATLIKALEDNICNKVTRQLVEGSMEVYEIAGYGAVSEGYHTFFNKLEPDAPQKPSKFITIWKQTDNGWKMSRIVSLH